MRGTALVTGSARRIGRTIALALARRGWDVAVHYRGSGDAAKRTADEIRRLGRQAHVFQCDLGRPEDLAGLIPEVRRACPDLSVLVNNASIFEAGTLAETDDDLFERIVATNLKAPLFLVRDFARHLESGHIVNLVDQRITRHSPEHFVYTLTKKALAEATRMASVEFGPRIRVNGVCPGLILPPEDKDEKYFEGLADRVPLRAAGGPEDVAGAVVYLLESAYVTGQLLFVDGGEHIT